MENKKRTNDTALLTCKTETLIKLDGEASWSGKDSAARLSKHCEGEIEIEHEFRKSKWHFLQGRMTENRKSSSELYLTHML